MIVIREYMVHRFFQGTSPPLTGQPLDQNLLESALNAPAQTFDGQELYPTLADKAACLFRSIIKNHAFLDGNKRTAVLTTVVFVLRNRRLLLTKEGEISDLALWVAESKDSEETIARLREWFGHRVWPRARPRRRSGKSA